MQPKMSCLIGGGSCDFQPSFRGGSLRFVPNGRGGSCVFWPPHFEMLRPIPLVLFDQSLNWDTEFLRWLGDENYSMSGSRSQDGLFCYSFQHDWLIPNRLNPHYNQHAPYTGRRLGTSQELWRGERDSLKGSCAVFESCSWCEGEGTGFLSFSPSFGKQQE